MNSVFIFILGLVIGSFLNVVLWRLSQNESFLKGRSYCPHCRKKIFWYDNIPILSYLILQGRCRQCHKNISLQYPLIELVSGIIFLWLYLQLGLSLEFFIAVILSCFLLIIFVYDLKYLLILDQVVIPAMVIAFLANLYLGFRFWDLVLAAIIGGGFFGLQFILSAGRWIGGGDIRLGFLMGLILGVKMLLVALLLAYLSGAIIGIILIAAGKKKMSSQIPFGTFLSLSTFITILYGPQLLHWYLNLFNF